MQNNIKCPSCGEKLVDIVYGLPGNELMEKSIKKEVFLAGCCIIGGIKTPSYYCYKCNEKFYKDLSKYDEKVRFKLN